MNDYWVGAVGGLAASAAMYAFLLPLLAGGPSPPAQIVARIGRREPDGESARLGGYFLQAAFGLFWGLLMAYWNTIYYPVGGSYLTQGLVWGLAAFVLSYSAFVALGLSPGSAPTRQWMGYLLCHLLFGLGLGVAFVAAGPVAG